MEFIQIIVMVVGLFAISRAWLRLKESKITLGEFLFWLFIWAGATVISIFPGVLSFMSERSGFRRGMDFLLALSIIVLFYLLFRVYVKIEETNKKLTEIVRKIALREK